jgi:HrpA-like RNA helicase
MSESLPTLLRKGFIIPPAKASKAEKDRIKNIIAIDYITNYISDRIPLIPGSSAKKPAKSAGDKVIILKSDTGSGKSTVLPPTLYKLFQERTRKNIAVTQPRVLTAVDIPTGLPDFYSDLKMDINLGYITGPMRRAPKEKGVIFMTTGILLQQMLYMEPTAFMQKYSFILLDEVHERDINIDSALYMLKKLLSDYYDDPGCPIVILMSATFHPKLFIDYFGAPTSNYFQVVGKTFPIEHNFAKFDIPNFVKYIIFKAEEVHIDNIADIEEGNKFRDILIFVHTAPAVKAIVDALHLFNSTTLTQPFSEVIKYIDNKKNQKLGGTSDDKRYHIAPIALTSANFYQSGADYQNLFADISDISIPIYKKISDNAIDSKVITRWVKPTRRIIVSTNVAETGVTIDSLKYCIDSGYVFGVQFNPDFGCRSMASKNITRGMAIQRRGRVGRKSPGQWYTCYTEKTYNALKDDQYSEILTEDITGTLLNVIFKETETTLIEETRISILDDPKQIKANSIFQTNHLSNSSWYKLEKLKTLNFSAIDFIESPSASSLVFSVEKLYGLGFIDAQFMPTILGYYADKMRIISIENKRMILAGYTHGANIFDLMTITAFLHVGRRRIFKPRKYKPLNPLKIDDKSFEFYHKILIADEFVECILVWELFSEFLDNELQTIHKKSEKGAEYIFSISKIKKWCDDRNILYDGMLKVISERDDLLETMISIGLNPYYNGIGMPKGQYNLLKILRDNLQDGIDEIKKIKSCIMDGYRFNLCLFDKSIYKYVSVHRNIPIVIQSSVISRMGGDSQQNGPKFIIVDDISMFQQMNGSGMYEFSSKTVCVLDGFVDVDPGFLLH